MLSYVSLDRDQVSGHLLDSYWSLNSHLVKGGGWLRFVLWEYGLWLARMHWCAAPCWLGREWCDWCLNCIVFSYGWKYVNFFYFFPINNKLYWTFLSYFFFIIHRTDSVSDSSFKKTSLFLISKIFQSVLGGVCSIKKLHSGDFLVKVTSASPSELLSKVKRNRSLLCINSDSLNCEY